MIRFDKIDQDMSESVMPQLVSIDHHQETIEDEVKDQIMNQECDNNELVVDDDQFWTYPFSPGNCMFLDDLSVHDYIPS